ncbi:MAG: hypothetical protein H6907_16870 [Hyphomicrobiales bacterium]|nr:hypothetical protein [Hyphomicrobiales bacterium]MCP5373402.1 hypothetical protein [Hyphomicrobiales bacterium]
MNRQQNPFRRRAAGLVLALAALVAAGPAVADEQAQVLTDPVPQIQGPKRVVAVGKFDAVGAFKQKYGDWDVGGGVSSMLTTALKESDRFIVLERANVSQILSEQELKGQKLVHQGSGPQIGKIIGVNIMIYGSVVEFGADDQGGGFSLGASGSSGGGGGGGLLGSVLSAAVSKQSSSGKVVLEVRFVDTTTTEILEVFRAAEDIDNSSWDLSLGYKGISMGTNQFYKTPLGHAVRKAITRIVIQAAARANQTPWSAQVVEFDQQEIYINAGGRAGVRVGDRFQVERIVKIFTDPSTGQILGKRKKVVGTIELTGVEDKLAFGSFVPLSNLEPQRGDLVVMEGAQN